MNIVIDTNVFISALIKDSLTRKIIVNSPFTLLFPEFEFTELKKHQKMILKKSGLSKNDYFKLMKRILNYVKIVKTDSIVKYKKQAIKIIKDIDKDDAIFIATAMAHKAPVWSDDKNLKMQKKIRIFSTQEIISLLKIDC